MDLSPIADMKFETALAELESIVSRMESGQLELEASIAAYQRGNTLMQHCQALLNQAEAKIQIIENGQRRDIDRKTLESQ